jgi:hypothetical protein
LPKLNIHKFLTPETAAHCKKLKHRFSPLDMAVIVAQSKRPLKERLAAWRWIVDECPDMPIRGNGSTLKPQKSLHKYMNELVAGLEGGTKAFLSMGRGVVYTPSVLLFGNHHKDREDDDYTHDLGSYSTAEKAVKEAAACARGTAKIVVTNVHRHIIDKPNPNDEMVATFDSRGEMTGVWGRFNSCHEQLLQIFTHLPIPFERGDVIVGWGGRPAVVARLPHDLSDYQDFVSGAKDGGSPCGLVYDSIEVDRGTGHRRVSVFRMESFRGELEGPDRFLADFGQFIKNGGDESALGLIHSYRKFRAEEEWRELTRILAKSRPIPVLGAF